LGNIHHLKSSANSMVRVLTEPTRESSVWGIGDASALSSSSMYSSPEIGAWLTNVSQLLRSTMRIVDAMDTHGVCAWTHCSDGWDRTSQMCALAQLIMDPEYRTRTGFAILVEKNFGHFGFKFRERARGVPHISATGSVVTSSTIPRSSSPVVTITTPTTETVIENAEEEASPVLMLFLDSVFQLLYQFPDRFEFNENFLVAIADAYVSGKFGNFLCNTERERIEKKIKLETRSLWDWLCFDEVFANSKFSSYHGVLFANCAVRALRLFEAYWARFDCHRQTDAISACFY